MNPVGEVPQPVQFSLRQPDTEDTLSPYVVPYERLMGRWHVVASTLPLWKNKRDVTITYSPIPGAPETTFDDLVEFRREGATAGSKPWTVRGIDTIETDVKGNGARWKWRGKGWLRISTSHWQILGFSLSPVLSLPTAASAPAAQPDWVVTYFSSTLFTPAGLDIYARDPAAISDAFVDSLTAQLEALGGEVGKLAQGGKMFRIPHGVEQSS